MRLTSITIENYRSITTARRVAVSEMTVIVGPNNEGKSNILRALVTAMSVLTSARPMVVRSGDRIVMRSSSYSSLYQWETDFPINLQEKKPNGQSVIILEFKLTPTELLEFKTEIRSSLNGTLPIKISLGSREVAVSVYKKGPGGPALTKKSQKIAIFVANRLEFEHIQAVRTAGSAEQIVSTLLERELAKLEENPEYVNALKRIAELQQPVLDQLSGSVKQTLVKFLPKVTDVTVQVPDQKRFRAMRRACEIVVDDGTPTLLHHKGDGVQSLAALALMRHAAETSATGKHLVIAIEEPESHLHSSAIHEIRDVLAALSQRHQVIVTTHNALFVDRARPSANILVSQRKARPAQTIAEIREILGVRAADNLRHATLVVLVEGKDDAVALEALLSDRSSRLRKAFSEGTIAFDPTLGASNLSYKLGQLRAAICSTHCILDDDDAGRKAYASAEKDGLATAADTNFLTCRGKPDAELEDLYDVDFYRDLVQNKYRVLLGATFRSNKKWSVRMRETFKQQGKTWSERVEGEIKLAIAEKVHQSPKDALHQQHAGPIDSLIFGLEQRLAEPVEHST